MNIRKMVQRSHAYATRQGFWDEHNLFHPLADRFDNVLLMLSKLMLVDTEVAEAAEAVRHGDRENFTEELADVCIRVFDIAGATGVNLESAIEQKMKVNEARSPMHGKRA